MVEEYLKRENERLREILGSWRRKAQDKHSRRELLREGFSNHDNGHYKVYLVNDIPGDLEIREVLHELKNGFLKEVKPYLFNRVDYSKKHDGWVVEVVYPLLDVDMNN